MAINPTYPGVYVQEIPGGSRAIAGVSSSTALFIGQSAEGPLDTPILCTSYEDFTRAFGEDRSVGDLAAYVRLFYMNGGSRCYVMRIAHEAKNATVALQNYAGGNAISLEAKNAGASGNRIRATVHYAGKRPGSTFHLRLFEWRPTGDGGEEVSKTEEYKNLSMDPDSDRYVEMVLNNESDLVRVTETTVPDEPPAAVSISGREIDYNKTADVKVALGINDNDRTRSFRMNVGNSGPFEVTVQFPEDDALPKDDEEDEYIEIIEEAIHQTMNTTAGHSLTSSELKVQVVDGHLRLASSEGDIEILPWSDKDTDLASRLMLGTAHGGIEIGRYAASRPVPTGFFIDPSIEGIRNKLFDAFAKQDLGEIEKIAVTTPTRTGTVDTRNIEVNNFGGLGTGKILDNSDNGPDGIRKTLSEIARVINAYQSANRRDFFVRAKAKDYHLVLEATQGHSNFKASLALIDDDEDENVIDVIEAEENVRHYSFGTAGDGKGFQESGIAGDDGASPTLVEYENAFTIADREIDLFNLVVLPPRAEKNQLLAQQIYGPASVVCEEQRAFLLMDPPDSWADVQSASQGVDELRIGLVTDYAAVFYPKIRIVDGTVERDVGPAGAIAGLIARTDGSRGIWKSPAGVEANLRGVIGLSRKMSDTENGVINERGINALRVFPNGVVNWGARTLDGDDDFASEWKYIPIRRLALHIQESLYRGLKWAVFEPNGQQLWSQIRATVGSFMHRLYKQGAFGGESASDAYFVKCDSGTTPPSDQALGIVNVRVGFRPLYPAEFVVLTLQQKTAES